MPKQSGLAKILVSGVLSQHTNYYGVDMIRPDFEALVGELLARGDAQSKDDYHRGFRDGVRAEARWGKG